MAAHPAPAPEASPAPEFPLLVIASPSAFTLIAALATVAGFAIAVTVLLARMIGSED